MNQVAPEHPGEDQPILIAYDGSDQAKAAIALAGRNLRTPRGAMVVSVFEPLGAIPFWGVPVARVPAPFIQEAEDAAKKVSEEGDRAQSPPRQAAQWAARLLPLRRRETSSGKGTSVCLS